MDNLTPEHEHRSNMSRNALAAEGMTRPPSAYGDVAPEQYGANGHSAGSADVVINDPAAVQQPLQSPFGSHQANVRDESEINEKLNQVTRKTPRDRWRDAGKNIAEKGTIRFKTDDTHAPAEPSANDTAHRDTPLASALERKPSGLLGRSSLGPRISSSLNLSKLGKSFTDNKAGNQAFAETVRLAQQQQQANRQSAAPVLKAVPSTKVMTAKKRQKVEAGLMIPTFIIHPYDFHYRLWVFLTVLAAAWSGIYIPFALAFQHVPGLYPYTDGNAVFNYIFMVIFFVDSCLSFRVAIIENDILITDSREIAKNYLSARFWVDFAAWFPFDWIVLWCFDAAQSNNFHRWLGLLTLLRMLRMYRVVWFYQWCEYSSNIKLLWLTLLRNMSYAWLVAHWAACIFYFIARQNNFTDTTWVGNNGPLFDGKPNMIRYIWSLYWSVTTLATVGYGDLHAYGPIEAAFILCYMLLGIILNAYILGTITLLIIKHDEQTGNFRDKTGVLKEYSSLNKLPRDLVEAMNAHLRLHFVNDELADQKVLSIYPTTLRRRALRHLYLQNTQMCYLFQGCRQKLLDSLLGASTVQLFMPRVEVVAEGDHLHELYIVLAGLVETFKPGVAENAEDISLHVEAADASHHGDGSYHGSMTRGHLTVGDCFGEVAFFTEIPQMQTVRTVTVCRVLVVPRTAYQTIKSAFPLGTRQMLDNLQAHAELIVEEEFKHTAAKLGVTGPEASALAHHWASPEATGLPMTSNDALEDSAHQEQLHRPHHYGNGKQNQLAMGLDLRQASIGPGDDALFAGDPHNVPRRQGLQRMSSMQQQVLGDLLRVRTLVRQHTAKHDESRTQEYLYAAARGDTSQIQQMLQQGFPPDSCDYDKRTGLMLASTRGHIPVVELLLAAGAPVDQLDSFGQTALSEACKFGQEETIAVLRRAGAK
ncbi:TPA: hypothetical protein ACH3X1_016329 [Trebouxia sp. C0004]